MKFTELICRLASERFDGPAQVGARLSPVILWPEEAPQLVADARRLFSERAVYISISVPEVEAISEERVCISPSERAAEKATEWRNNVNVQEGERVLYVSVVRQGKAGGLRDVLYELTEKELREAFIDWCMSADSGMPPGLGAAMRRAGVHEKVDARALCAYSEAVLQGSDEAARWDAAGWQLPLLSLAPDSKLQTAPEARLKANTRWIKDVSATERKVSSLTSSAKKVRSAISAALTQSTESVEAALSLVDLGALSQKDLSSDVSTKSRRSSRRAKKPPPKPKPAAPQVAKPKSSPPQTQRQKRRRDRALIEKVFETEAQAPAPARAEPTPAPAVPPAAPAPTGAPSSLEATHAPRETAASPPPQPKPRPRAIWSAAMQRKEFGTLQPKLPAGLEAMLLASLGHPGWVRYSVKSGPLRKLLVRSTRNLPPPELDALDAADQPWASAWARWSSAREALAGALAGDKAPQQLAKLAGAPLLMLDGADFRALVEAYLRASEALLGALKESKEDHLIEQGLSLETVLIDAESGEQLRIVSPLHPLWLGQALHRYRQLARSLRLSPTARRLLARSITQSVAGPRRWGALERGASVSGLLMYEDDPMAISEAELEDVAAMVLQRHLDLHPYAQSSLRVAVEGHRAEPVLDAVAGLLRKDVVQAVSIHLATPATSEKADPALLRSGRLKLLPMQRAAEAIPAPPHLHISIAPRPPQEVAPLLPDRASIAAPLTAYFWVDDAGRLCRAVSLAGVPGAQAVPPLLSPEAEHTCFTESLSQTALAALFPGDPEQPVSWRVALGASISGSPRRGELVLTRERIESVDVAVLTSDERPLSRSLAKFFKGIGIMDVRPSRLRQITRRLCAKSRDGLLSMEARTERLIAARLLELSLRDMSGGSSLFASPRGELCEVLLGADEQDNPYGCFGLTIAPSGPDGLQVSIGYAAMAEALGANAEGSRVTGPLWDQLSRLADAVLLSAEDSVGGRAARDLLRGLFWPLIPDQEDDQEQHTSTLERLRPGAALNLSVLCLLPSEHPLTQRTQTSRIRTAEVNVTNLDAALVQRMLLRRR